MKLLTKRDIARYRGMNKKNNKLTDTSKSKVQAWDLNRNLWVAISERGEVRVEEMKTENAEGMFNRGISSILIGFHKISPYITVCYDQINLVQTYSLR